MTTSRHLRDHRRLGGALSLALSVALLAGTQVAVAADQDYSADRIPEEDLAVLSELRVGAQPPAKITKEGVLEIVRDHYDVEAMGAKSVEAYLETATLETTLDSDAPIIDRPVWIVHFSGMQIQIPGPITESGEPAKGHVLDNIYDFFDADTGEYLLGIWTE